MSKPSIEEMIPLIKDYYAKPLNGVGGSLHIVLDDGNLENGDVEFCREWAIEHNDEDGIKLADLLLQMSATQRGKIYARYDLYRAL